MFPTTAWSLLEDAKDLASGEQTAAMNRFVVGYWRPVYGFIRAKGYAAATAEDLTQEFFLRLYERHWLAKAEPSRGRFRNYLLTILVRFLADQGAGRAPRQQQFDCRLVPISSLVRDSEKSFDVPDEATPQDIFMRQWAQALVADVRNELEVWCRSHGRPDWYEIFCAHHFPPPGEGRMSQEDLAARLRCSRDQLRYALQQTASLFRAAIVSQVTSDDEVDAEIRDIEQLLSP